MTPYNWYTMPSRESHLSDILQLLTCSWCHYAEAGLSNAGECKKAHDNRSCHEQPVEFFQVERAREVADDQKSAQFKPLLKAVKHFPVSALDFERSKYWT